MLIISIHAPPRGATCFPICWNCCQTFQFTPLREGRRKRISVTLGMKEFQFTPLREGRRNGLSTRSAFANFNSRPSARGDRGREESPRRHKISIHAPPRGATGKDGHPAGFRHFNSRPSARGDATKICVYSCGGISIHAPPRGATRSNADVLLRYYQFQFTPLREGRRRVAAGATGTVLISIHAPPRGATRREANRHYSRYFNSRPSARGDRMAFENLLYPHRISIHAPPRGATGRLRGHKF